MIRGSYQASGLIWSASKCTTNAKFLNYADANSCLNHANKEFSFLQMTIKEKVEVIINAR